MIVGPSFDFYKELSVSKQVSDKFIFEGDAQRYKLMN